MARWSVGRVRRVPPISGSDREDASAIHFSERDLAEPNMTVEYAAGGGGRHASAHARSAVTPCLDDEDPPRRLIVDRDGNVRPQTD